MGDQPRDEFVEYVDGNEEDVAEAAGPALPLADDEDIPIPLYPRRRFRSRSEPRRPRQRMPAPRDLAREARDARDEILAAGDEAMAAREIVLQGMDDANLPDEISDDDVDLEEILGGNRNLRVVLNDGRDDAPGRPSRPGRRRFIQRRDAPYEIPEVVLYQQMVQQGLIQIVGRRIPPPPLSHYYNNLPTVPAGGSIGGMQKRTLSRRASFPISSASSGLIPDNIDESINEVLTNLKSNLSDDLLNDDIEKVREFWQTEAMSRELKVLTLKLSRHILNNELVPAELLVQQMAMHKDIDWLLVLLITLTSTIQQDSD